MKKTLIFFIVPYLFWGQEFQSNLPIVVINTNGKVIVDNPRIVCDMGVIHNPSSINKISDQACESNDSEAPSLNAQETLSSLRRKLSSLASGKSSSFGTETTDRIFILHYLSCID